MNDVAWAAQTSAGSFWRQAAKRLAPPCSFSAGTTPSPSRAPRYCNFSPCPPACWFPGRAARFSGAVYDTGCAPEPCRSPAGTGRTAKTGSAEQMALHWRERYENVERPAVRAGSLCVSGGCPTVSALLARQRTSPNRRSGRAGPDPISSDRPDGRDPQRSAQSICVKDSNLRYIAVNKAFCVIHDLRAGRHARTFRLEPRRNGACGSTSNGRTAHVLETGMPHSEAEAYRSQPTAADLWVVTRKISYRPARPPFRRHLHDRRHRYRRLV